MTEKELNEGLDEEELKEPGEAGSDEDLTKAKAGKKADAGQGPDEDPVSDNAAADEENDTGEASEGEDNKGKKKILKKKKDKKDEQIEQLTDRVKRQMAEFENFRKRTEKEKSSMYEMGAKSVIEKILPVIDNFERGLDSVPEEEKDAPFAEGMRMIYKQLMTELDSMGVKPIEALGAQFDPEFHNAVMQVESGEYESGHVAQELQKGYMYRDTVVRHSMVAVVQ
ncbi:MAG: nucleotide exchange factor GrpE [Lachnospiraceae bacterium]|nr:nucleotide exchange factor GrpE [Lachnospiraceae bacterium]